MARGRFAKKIDSVHWTGTGFAFKGLAAGTIAQIAIAAQHLPETLLRIRGEWAAILGAAAAPGVGIFVVAGAIMVPEGTGSTVLWSPDTDSDAPWIWWDVFNLLYRETVTDVIAGDVHSRARVIDSKAMRKNKNMELQFVVENTTASAFSAASVDLIGSVRVLSGS